MQLSESQVYVVDRRDVCRNYYKRKRLEWELGCFHAFKIFAEI